MAHSDASRLQNFPVSWFSTVMGLAGLTIALLPHYPGLSQIVWTAGTVLHFGFTLYVLSVWIHHTHFEINHMNPAWFIPIVGNILVPIAGVHHASAEISWFFFSIGLVIRTAVAVRRREICVEE